MWLFVINAKMITIILKKLTLVYSKLMAATLLDALSVMDLINVQFVKKDITEISWIDSLIANL